MSIADGESISEGRRRASAAREQWRDATIDGEITFRHLVDKSKSDQEPGKYLGKIKLLDLLAGRPGWTKITALEAMSRVGFDASSTILSIRRSNAKIERFSLLMDSTATRWRARPVPPKGWPWAGKLSVLVESAGRPVPDELVLDEVAEETTDEDSLDEALDSLLGDSLESESSDVDDLESALSSILDEDDQDE